MLNRKTSYITLSAFLSSSGTVGGYALTYKMVGGHAALSFLKLGILMVLASMLVQIILFVKGKKRVMHLILFNMAFSFGLLWFLLCLILPLFLMSSVHIFVKLIIFVVSIAFWAVNVLKGVQIFRSKWALVGERLLSRYYVRARREMDWSGLVGALKMSVSIYIPGIPQKMNAFISVLTLIFMLAGLSLRNVFPNFSIFAWSIPLIIVMGCFMQMMGLGVAQFLTLDSLERKDNAAIRPVEYTP